MWPPYPLTQQLRKAGGQQHAGDRNSAVRTLDVGRCKDGGIFKNTSPVSGGAHEELNC